jgi:hypothetical protein
MSFPPGESATTEYDSAWKEAIEYAFEPFMAFFFPQAHKDIDWQNGYDFLDAELQRYCPTIRGGTADVVYYEF